MPALPSCLLEPLWDQFAALPPTERNGAVVEFCLHLAATLVRLRMLTRRSTSRYRWDGRPTTRRLK